MMAKVSPLINDEKNNNNNNSNNNTKRSGATILSDNDDDIMSSLIKSKSKNELTRILGLITKELKCSICYDYFIDPIPLNCGHTFCRLCIIECHRKSSKKCPYCRAPSHIDTFTHSCNMKLTNIIKILNNDEYNKRLNINNNIISKMNKDLYVFTMPLTIFETQYLHLNLFEPRYMTMIKRCLSSSNKFIFITPTLNTQNQLRNNNNNNDNNNNNNNDDYTPLSNDVGLVIQVIDAEYTHNNCCIIKGLCISRVQIIDAWIEPDTAGLYRAEYIKHCDDDVKEASNIINSDETSEINTFMDKIFNKFNDIPRFISHIQSTCGERVKLTESTLIKWSFYSLSFTYTIQTQIFKLNVNPTSWYNESFTTKNVLKRVQILHSVISQISKSIFKNE